VAAVVITGGWLRFSSLARHFTHNDDIGVAQTIVDAKLTGRSPWLAVPEKWTYAPAQFLVTARLIDPEYSYRDILFWGRLPSAVLGFGGILLAGRFLFKCFPGAAFPVALGLALFSCSWQNVIISRQMHNYAAGVTAHLLVLNVLISVMRSRRGFWQYALVCPLVSLAACYVQYSLLFFMPAFWMVVIYFAGPEKRRVVRLLPGLAFFSAGVFFLYVWFLKNHSGAGVVEWSQGVNQEFLFQWDKEPFFWNRLCYAFKFFFVNAFLIFDSQVSFIYGKPVFSMMVTAVIAVFALAGLWGSVRSSEKVSRGMAVYALVAVVTWSILVVFQKLTFSPTRHYALYLPLIIYFFTRGVERFCRLEEWKAVLKPEARDVLSGVWPLFVIGICVLTLAQWPRYARERDDPFDENLLARWVGEYRPDAILAANWTPHLELMPRIREIYKTPLRGSKKFAIMSGSAGPYRRIAWISHREPFGRQNFISARNYYLGTYKYVLERGGRPPFDPRFLSVPYQRYRIIKAWEYPSEVEMELSPMTRNGSNGFYFYIIDIEGR
jgi:hypothetical protein